MRKATIASLVFITILFVAPISSIPIVTSCKNIVVTPPATAGDYSLLLKIRDPSRPGLQVLCRVPAGTQYTYHHPWTGRPWDFTTTRTFFGVATKGDTYPNIIKAGMVLSDAGIAFGDSDTNSNWINPTKHSWDDFDWIRYACQTACNEDEAIQLLTADAVDRLHATGVSENLFVIGPQRAVVIEADAVHYTIKDINGILVRSNYAVDLWKTQVLRSLPIAASFNTTKEPWVESGNIIRLQSICGVKVIQTSDHSITVKAVPSFAFRRHGLDKEIIIRLGERATVGPYSVNFIDIDRKNVKISVSTAVYAWEQEVLSHIEPKSGTITIQDMIHYSRLHTTDLDDLRPMCEDEFMYEAAMIFKIPKEHPKLLSSGWFAANHACSSIYVPFHICNNDIYDPYQTGEAASLCLDLLQQYGHGTLTPLCSAIEEVFFYENELNELIAREMINNSINITAFLTTMDRGMQEQAFLTQQLWRNASNTTQGIFDTIWQANYTTSLKQMEKTLMTLKNISDGSDATQTIEKIALSIGHSKINALRALGRNCSIFEINFNKALHNFKAGDYTDGFILLQHMLHSINTLIQTQTTK